MKPLIKWPGGKTTEIAQIADLIPADYDRYIEPFFGGGAVYFYLEPKKALINDISENLMEFYRLIQSSDPDFKAAMYAYADLWQQFLYSVESGGIEQLYTWYLEYRDGERGEEQLREALGQFIEGVLKEIPALCGPYIPWDIEKLRRELCRTVPEKYIRTCKNERKKDIRLSEEDLKENLLTGFTGGLYMYFRQLDNDITLGRIRYISRPVQIANFYFIREYCYGSMFRYNRAGEFNIPYGGMSYNRKHMRGKLTDIFSDRTAALLRGAEIRNQDFESLLKEETLSEQDFMFLDPPYDTTFSAYEGREFGGSDQERLAEFLGRTKAQFILIIKNTDFIYSLYQNRNLEIYTFENRYLYNVRSRNDRTAEHLIITNIRSREKMTERLLGNEEEVC